MAALGQRFENLQNQLIKRKRHLLSKSIQQTKILSTDSNYILDTYYIN